MAGIAAKNLGLGDPDLDLAGGKDMVIACPAWLSAMDAQPQRDRTLHKHLHLFCFSCRWTSQNISPISSHLHGLPSPVAVF